MKKVTDINKLTQKLKDSHAENATLLNKIKELENQLLKERRQFVADKILLEHYQGQLNYAVADLSINPEPKTVHGTFKNKGINFLIELMDVVVIRSKGRMKEIFTKTPLRPIEGGQKHNSILINNEESDFNKTLHFIQGRSTHLLRANKSIAVNLHYYDIDSSQKLVLNLETVPDTIIDFKEIKTDKFFDVDTFHKRKIEFREINRYKKSPPVP